MDVSTILNGNPFKPLASTTRSSIDLSAVKAALNESVTDGTTTTQSIPPLTSKQDGSYSFYHHSSN